MFFDWVNAVVKASEWTGFVSTLLATVAGAVIAVVGTFLLARRDRRERYAVRLNEALSRVLTASAAYLTVGEVYVDFLDGNAHGPLGTLVEADAPSSIELEGALAVVRLVARGKDRDVADWLAQAFDTATRSDPPDLPLVASLPRAVLKWARGEKRTEVLREVIVRNGAR